MATLRGGFSPGNGRLKSVASMLAAFSAMTAIPTLAWADCEPANPSSGATVTCTGNPNGFSTDGLGSLTVNIVSGTNLNGPLTASNTGVLGITNAGNLQSMTLTDNGAVTFTNSANINSGVTIVGDGDHNITNQAGGNLNQTFSISGNGNNSVTNFGTLNPGIVVNGDGTLAILNDTGSFINQQIAVTGAADTTVDNFGTIQGTFTLDMGDDVVTNHGGATINANVVQGGANDQFLMLGGRVNGEIQQGDGNDIARLEAGEISGFVRAGANQDNLLWTGGLVGGIDMGTENDQALFIGLTDTELRAIQIDGGLGSDTLTWQDVQGSRPDRLVNWELISLTNGSQLTMGGNLVLGDTGTGTGALTIDSTSTLFASEGQYTIQPAVNGQGTTVTNAGTMDLTRGGASVTDTLTIVGDYHGDNGALLLNTVLAGDGAPSDRLIVTGNETGITRIFVTNVGGSGDLTSGDGILVDEDINGVSDGAFVLGNVVAAGAYEYRLVQGGTSPGTENNWYLVTHATDTDGDGDGDEDGDDDRDDDEDNASPDTDGDGDGDGHGNGTSDGDDAADGGAGGDGGDADADVDGNPDIEIPLYRPEVPIHSPVPAMGRALTRATLGTFHEREGEQVWSRRNGGFEAAWLRSFGMLHEQSWKGDLDPTFDGNLWGLQAGLPMYLSEHQNGQRDVFGLFAGFGRATGDVRGFALGRPNLDVGHLSIDSYSVGGYWTHHWPNEAYVDGVLMFSWLDAEARSNRGIGVDIDGTEIAASIETGIPFDISESWQIEPQAQLIWQHQSFDRASDLFSTIDFHDVDAVTGRIGGRLVGEYLVNDVRLRPFAKANIWHAFSGNDTLTYNSFTTLITERESTSLEVGLGLTADFNQSTSLYANVDYSTDISGEDLEVWEGRVGLRVAW
ncbi:MAG TPA: autotransporter outer membrane beta-barrel domain-containing protein [Rhizobiaceae bacterium]|nr:autotransporter outer membrane beta-barrel domain-containing protein [Rhizobiaceae bacterium]